MSNNNSLIAVCVQCTGTAGAVTAHTNCVRDYALRATKQYQADMVIFPELTLSGYPPEDILLRPDFHAQIHAALEALCAFSRTMTPGLYLVLGYPDQIAPGMCYNAACVIQDGHIIATYHKHCLPNYGVFDEKRYFMPGQTPCVFTCNGIRLGLQICEDVWETGPAEQAKQAGAQALIVLQASPFDVEKPAARFAAFQRTVQRTGLPLIFTNWAGAQDDLLFDGQSGYMHHTGQYTVTHTFEPGYLVCQLTQPHTPHLTAAPVFTPLAETACPVSLPIHPTPNLAARLPNTLPYRWPAHWFGHPTSTHPQPHNPTQLNNHQLATVYYGLVQGIRQYAHNNHFSQLMLGVSGGIDSALTLALAVDALGAKQVNAYLLPSRYTEKASLEMGEQLCRNWGVSYRTLSIESLVHASHATLSDHFPVLRPITQENLQARSRGLLLMAISNETGALLLSTSNKSETAVGYSTLYGDMVGGLSVLQDVYKTRVYQLAYYRNALAKTDRIPVAILERPPSAELAENQCDQDSLPPYPLLDSILYYYLEKSHTAPQLHALGFSPALVGKITKQVHQSEYKRRQAPFGLRITSCAFYRERRYPISTSL